MRLRPAISALLAASLAACTTIGPNYVRPTAPIAATYAEAEGWKPARPGDLLDRGDWWALFNDPVLDGLERRVAVSNQNIAAAEAAYRQAQALVREQRAALFPTVDLGANAGVSHGGGSTSQSYRVALNGSWDVDLWGRIRRTVEAASANAQASQADLAGATLSAQGELAADYVGLRETDAEISLGRLDVAGYQRTLQIARNRYAAGLTAHSDALQAQTQLDNAEADLAGLQQQRDTYAHAIAVLVGEAPGGFTLAAVAAWTPTIPNVPVGLPSTLLERRPDIAAAERRVAAANAQIGIARSAYFPDLTLTGSLGFASSELGRLVSASSFLWSLGAALAETVFDAGARGARVAEARAAYDQTVAQYRQTVLTALQDVEDQLIAGRVLERQVSLRQDAANSADQAERMVLNRYRAGQITYVDVVTAETAATNARRAVLQANAQRQSAAIALIQALGGPQSGPAPGALPAAR